MYTTEELVSCGFVNVLEQSSSKIGRRQSSIFSAAMRLATFWSSDIPNVVTIFNVHVTENSVVLGLDTLNSALGNFNKSHTFSTCHSVDFELSKY